MLKVDASDDWKRFGETDPYFGVLSKPEYRGRALTPAAEERFFASGRRHVQLLLAVVHDMLGECPRGRALDFGCGVGRITQALAAEYEQVVGLDIAPGMLAEARKNATQGGLHNVEYRNSLDAGSLDPQTYDLVHSYIVIQHIPVRTGERLIRQLIDAVRPGGIGALHITIAPAAGRTAGAVRNLVKRNKLLRVAGNLARGRRWDAPAMEMNQYRTERIIGALHASGIDRFSCVYVDDWGVPGVFFLFRRQPEAVSPWSNPAAR